MAQDEDPASQQERDGWTTEQRDAIDALRADARLSSTVALLVVHRGKAIIAMSALGALERAWPLYSITKLFVGMAIGQLVAEQRLSLSTPLSTFFPAWNTGQKSRVTIEHILRHTSGLQQQDSVLAIENAPDALKFAESLPVEHEPGAVFSYSNEAVELLSGVVQAASGIPLDIYVEQNILRPLNIRQFEWLHDPAGIPYGFGGLSMNARDLARVGEMMLRDGRWAGRQVLPSGWVRQTLMRGEIWTQTLRYGLLTCIYLDPRDQPPYRVIAFGHGGTGYQHLFVAPRSELVIVRFRNRRDDEPVRFDQDMTRVAEAFESATPNR